MMQNKESAQSVKDLSNVIKINEAQIQDPLGEMVRLTVEETLNAMLDAEADDLCNAKRYGIESVKSMPLAPNFSPFVERFIRSIKTECLDRMIILGEAHLRYCIQEYITHYHTERAHQGLDNMLIEPPPQGTGKIIRQERLGGLLKFYRRAA